MVLLVTPPWGRCAVSSSQSSPDANPSPEPNPRPQAPPDASATGAPSPSPVTSSPYPEPPPGYIDTPFTSSEGPFIYPDGTTLCRNQKKLALKVVTDSFHAEATDLGAYAAEPKSATLTEGLGGGGSVWMSPAADEAADSIRGIVNSINRRFKSKVRALERDWEDEPYYVESPDPRMNKDQW